jgi:hypothetical protein
MRSPLHRLTTTATIATTSLTTNTSTVRRLDRYDPGKELAAEYRGLYGKQSLVSKQAQIRALQQKNKQPKAGAAAAGAFPGAMPGAPPPPPPPPRTCECCVSRGDVRVHVRAR